MRPAMQTIEKLKFPRAHRTQYDKQLKGTRMNVGSHGLG